MPKQTYAFKPGGRKRLEVSWKGMWKDFTVKLDNQVVGEFSDQSELEAGQWLSLPDGSSLRIQLVQKSSRTELQVLRNGLPLAVSSFDPESRLRSACSMIFFIAGLNLVLGIATMLFRIEFLQALGIGFFSVIFGLVFLLLGFWAQSGSQLALILAIAIFALDGILGFVLVAMVGGTPNISGLIARIFFIIPMVRGLSAGHA